MDTIVIATDFTGAAHNATVYGVQLARQLQAKVLLLNVCKPLACTADMIRMASNQELLEESQELLKLEVDSILEYNVPIEARSVIGNPAEMISIVARDADAGWIVVGMKAKDKTMRKIFGSNAVSLGHHSQIPMIVVPEHAAFFPPANIALASDMENLPYYILDPLQQLGKRFDSYMFIVKVLLGDNTETIDRFNRTSRIKWHLKELHASYELLNDTDVAHAINDFVIKHSIDMLAMISREKSFLERLFTVSHIKEMMFQTNVPLIVLPVDPWRKIEERNPLFFKNTYTEMKAINGF